ncbi:cutinase family protein [Amycolatopsis balhimycina DSM 5908]|uniref:Cutinase family protein n=1 Tax=Amycolatopsis balhimycina DSM 5908 TaxID=1081091 RepID=A0A428X152_AMYBA|nr:cutinase family protein [Amycolatopsis balhimycina]RSM49092.1 cutinase family protein [Amycolatopsis balhimycina DSM 5908]
MIRVPRNRFLSAAATVGIAVAGLTVAAAPVASAAPCTDIDVPVARGTFEPGTLGLIVGDPVYQAIQNRLQPRSLSGYRVDYPADLGEPASVQKGNTDLVNHLRSQAASCPQQRFVLVGYSQGANVVDNSIGISSDGAIVGGPIVATIPADLAPRIAAILLFGNPIRAIGRQVTGTYQSRTKDYCASGDPICQSGGTDILAHLSYGGQANDAAAFAAGKV